MFLFIMCSLANIVLFLQFKGDVVEKFHNYTGCADPHSNNVRQSTFDHISNFKCVNNSDINGNIDYMYDNSVIELNN